jgi:GH15 family glucan-1,4-alpha-glucosidase
VNLVERSVEVILAGQHDSGAYVACPTFEPYRYCWWRDGSFVADAMSRVGQVESAERFFDWGARIVEAKPDGPWDARYNLDGTPERSEWPKLQLDGLGLWLWAIALHAERHDIWPERWRDAGTAVCVYLGRHWRDPCTDWWEEREGLHPTTVGSILAGLATWGDETAEELARGLAEITQQVRVDGSLIALVAPLRACEPEPITSIVEVGLGVPGGGVHRYDEDEYYGGGEWILLTAMLGLGFRRLGRSDDARRKLEWIEAHATGDGLLPEQVQDHLLEPGAYDRWVEKWGLPACPLLWSHAMYLTLAHELGEAT